MSDMDWRDAEAWKASAEKAQHKLALVQGWCDDMVSNRDHENEFMVLAAYEIANILKNGAEQ